jgi:perosamine synthetase
MIPLFQPSVSQAEIDEVVETLRSGWWGLGPKTAQLERECAEFVGARHACAVNSGTAALHLALAALDLPPGEVIVPALTFISTALAPLYAGHRPVFADIDADTLNLSPAAVARAIGPQTRAIIPVHYAGRPVDLEAMEAFGVPVIEDCAHAMGSRHQGQHVGSRNIGCFSFHAVKNLATADGGMVTTNDDRVAARLVPLRWVGIDKSTWHRAETRYGWDYQIALLGFKYHMNDVSAALGLAQLRRLEENNARRRRIVDTYCARLADLEWLQLPLRTEADRAHSWHLFAVRTDHRDAFVEWLLEHGVSAGVHYRPLTHHEVMRPYTVPGQVPVTEAEWQRLVTLPLYPDLTDNEIALVVETIRSFPAPATRGRS